MAEDEQVPYFLVERCPMCENTWRGTTRDRGASAGRPREFCSESCQRRSRRQMMAPYGPGESRLCAHCETSFSPPAKTGRPPLYCSPSCKTGAYEQRKRDDHRAWAQIAAATERLAQLRDDIHSERTRGSVQELQRLEAELSSLLTVVQYRIRAASQG